MTVRIVEADLTGSPLVFLFTVPGTERWTLRSVCATAHRGAGGTPNRGYSLVVTNGNQVIATIGAPDAGTDPGDITITWSDAPASAVALAATGIVVAPTPPLPLAPGFQFGGGILNHVFGDKWLTAVAWVDYVPS